MSPIAMAAAAPKATMTSAMRMACRRMKGPGSDRPLLRPFSRLVILLSRLRRRTFQNDTCDCVMLGMTKRNECGSDSASCGEFVGRSGENEKWFAARLFLDVDVAPTDCFADAGAECLGNSLFCRETRSQMTRREFHRHRVFNLAVGENTLEKTFAKLPVCSSTISTPNSAAASTCSNVGSINKLTLMPEV